MAEKRYIDAGVKLPAGKYYVGDPCYVINDENWRKICLNMDWDKHSNCGEKNIIRIGDDSYYEATTKYGDGGYKDNSGRMYSVDAGVIGVVPMSLVEKQGYLDTRYSHYHIADFDEEFDVYVDENKVFHIGDIIIKT